MGESANIDIFVFSCDYAIEFNGYFWTDTT